MCVGGWEEQYLCWEKHGWGTWVCPRKEAAPQICPYPGVMEESEDEAEACSECQRHAVVRAGMGGAMGRHWAWTAEEKSTVCCAWRTTSHRNSSCQPAQEQLGLQGLMGSHPTMRSTYRVGLGPDAWGPWIVGRHFRRPKVPLSPGYWSLKSQEGTGRVWEQVVLGVGVGRTF